MAIAQMVINTQAHRQLPVEKPIPCANGRVSPPRVSALLMPVILFGASTAAS
jgi:hypothetical protein